MINKKLKKLLRFPYKYIRRYRAKYLLKRLRKHDSPIIRELGSALLESLSGTFTEAEKVIIASIEGRRSFLMGLSNEISVTDYGAGSAESDRTKAVMHRGVTSTAKISTVCKASKSKFWATILFKIIRSTRPYSCLELGTCLGISAAYQASTLKMNGKGNITTLEGSPEIATIAEETINILNLNNTTITTGPFYQTLKKALATCEPIDYFFNDGHHDHDAVIEYFNESMPYLAEHAIIIFDDISWSTGMKKAWNEIQNDDRVAVSIDLRKIGIALISNKSNRKEKYCIPL